MKITYKNLTFQVLTAIFLGICLGLLAPKTAESMKILGDLFINMIKMLIAPIIFLTIVSGIGSIGSMSKLGRVGGKALLYFELVTTLALAIGLIVANITQPGVGVSTNINTKDKVVIAQYAESSQGLHWDEFILHIVPSNIFKAFAEGEILQILFFSVLFGISLNQLGDTGKSILGTCEKFSKALFKVMSMLMKVAPIGAFGGMAFTIGKYGIATLIPIAKLMITMYLTMFLFVFVVLNLIAYMYGFSLWKMLGYIKEELLIVLGTSSSESVLPRIMTKLENYGCSKSIVGLVVPTGYSFNLDGTTIYLSMAIIFLTQAFEVPLTFWQQANIIGILMLTSKGAAAVTGGAFIVLASTITALKILPPEAIAILLGVDRFMSEARAITNLIGNSVATIVIAKSEKEFDEEREV